MTVAMRSRGNNAILFAGSMIGRQPTQKKATGQADCHFPPLTPATGNTACCSFADFTAWWCNGSTGDFDSPSHGSNPCRAATSKKIRTDSQIGQRITEVPEEVIEIDGTILTDLCTSSRFYPETGPFSVPLPLLMKR